MGLEESKEILHLHNCKSIRIRKNTPFLSDILVGNNEIAIYYEQSYDKNINNYICLNYDNILKMIDEIGMNFIYIPILDNHIKESIQYHFPDNVQEKSWKFHSVDFYKAISDNVEVMPPSEHPMLLISDYGNEAGYSQEMLGEDKVSFFCYELEYENDKQFKTAIEAYLHKCGAKGDNIRFSLIDDNMIECVNEPDVNILSSMADYSDISIIASEIQSRINTLYAMGVNEKILRSIIKLPEPKLSQLIITEDFRIILLDYNNMEIKMPTLSKTIFFFYLRHEEGVLFKYLRDYCAELYEIYSVISPRVNADFMRNSIDSIVDSTKNSINEKCSRIKSAFASKFQDRLASHYYITGKYGEPKHITLDRSLVQDNSKLIMKP